MDAPVGFKIKVKMEKIVKGKKTLISDKLINQMPKFNDNIKLPLLHINKSFKLLPKPYPIAKVNMNPSTLKESSSLITIRNFSPCRKRKNIPILKNKIRKNHFQLSGESIKADKNASYLSKSLIENDKIGDQSSRINSKFRGLCITPELKFAYN